MTYAQFLVLFAFVLLAGLRFGVLWERSAQVRRLLRQQPHTPAERWVRVSLGLATGLLLGGLLSLPLGISLAWPRALRLLGGVALGLGAILLLGSALALGIVHSRPHRWVPRPQRPTARVPARPPKPPAT